MGKPAARIGDMHVCPMVTPGTPPIPHVGGPVVGPGAPTVLIGGMPAAVMGDMCTCVGPPDSIVLGSVGVMIGGKPAARMGDMCAHGGSIVVGCPTVLIGEVMPSPVAPGIFTPDTILMAFEFSAMSAAFTTQQSRISALIEGAERGNATVHKHNEEDCKVQYSVKGDDGQPLKNVLYEIHTSDGKVFSGKTGANGMTQQISGYTKSMCDIIFPK